MLSEGLSKRLTIRRGSLIVSESGRRYVLQGEILSLRDGSYVFEVHDDVEIAVDDGGVVAIEDLRAIVSVLRDYVRETKELIQFASQVSSCTAVRYPSVDGPTLDEVWYDSLGYRPQQPSDR